ncbi:unnamed protein product, partial [Rotaria sordida]
MKIKILIDHHYSLIHQLTDVDCEIKTLTPVKGYENNCNITLEETVESLRDGIAHLDDYVKQAKRRANTNPLYGLTIDESAAIYLYTMQLNDRSFSRMLNEALRYKDQTEVKHYWFNYLRLIWSALKKLPSIKGNVYQGITRRIKEKYLKKQVFTWWGITSCTQIQDNIVSAIRDKNSTLLKIKILNGKDISAYSCKSNENEIVLLPGIRLRVNNVSYNANFCIDEISLEEINDETLESITTLNQTKKCTVKDGPLDKIWLDCRFKDQEGTTIIKPNEYEAYLTEPPETIDESILNRIKGSIFGLILGDALGAHVEFRPHSYLVANPVTDLQGGGTWGLEKGQFTDDGSMILCLANSLVARHGFEPYDQLVRYKCAHGAAGNGVLMRLAPVPLFFYKNPEIAVTLSGISGQITHGDKKAVDACSYYVALIVAAMYGVDKNRLLSEDFYLSKIKNWLKHDPLVPEIEKIVEGSFMKDKGYDAGIRGKGYVVFLRMQSIR